MRCLLPAMVHQWTLEQCRYRIHKYYKEAGIKKKASVHTLRHTFSTHQIHNGLKINQLKEVLGHRRMETTYKYVHLDGRI